jgi:hypothetical protein
MGSRFQEVLLWSLIEDCVYLKDCMNLIVAFFLYLPIYNLLNRNKVISKCGICLCLEGGNYPAVVLIHFKYLSPLASLS